MPRRRPAPRGGPDRRRRRPATSSRVSPYLRRSSWRSWRRARTSSRRTGSSSQVSTTSRSSAARSATSAIRPRTRRSSGSSGARPASAPDACPSSSSAPGPPGPPSDPVSATRACRRRRTVGRRLGQPVLLRLERRLLVGARQAGALDLGHLEGQHLGLACPLAGVATQPLGLPQEGGQVAPGGVHRAGVHAAEGVQGVALGLGHHQGTVLVLAVQLQQARTWPRPARRAAPSGRRSRPGTGPRGRRVRATVTSSAPSTSQNRPSTSASSAPARTVPGSPRPPSSRPRAPTRRVLPAPVSPVSAVMPPPRATVTSSITPRSRTWSSTRRRPIGTPTGRPAGTSPAGWRGSPGRRTSRGGPDGLPPGGRPSPPARGWRR